MITGIVASRLAVSSPPPIPPDFERMLSWTFKPTYKLASYPEYGASDGATYPGSVITPTGFRPDPGGTTQWGLSIIATTQRPTDNLLNIALDRFTSSQSTVFAGYFRIWNQARDVLIWEKQFNRQIDPVVPFVFQSGVIYHLDMRLPS